MSGFLSEIGGLMSGSGVISAIPGILTQLVGTAQGAAGGGLTGLLLQLENAGLGEQVKSWLGPGENLPLTTEHVVAAFPPEQLDAWAAEAGITREQLASVLAHVLPQVIDHATPEGEVPAEDAATPNVTTVITRLLER
jgi:uncharacterized protein YidB (DUF937 family)